MSEYIGEQRLLIIAQIAGLLCIADKGYLSNDFPAAAVSDATRIMKEVFPETKSRRERAQLKSKAALRKRGFDG